MNSWFRASPGRVISVDVYRGLVMILMLAEVLSICVVADAVPDSSFWWAICQQQTHAAWIGMSLHDTIQPGFYFLVGMGVLFSTGRRRAETSTSALIAHVVLRSAALIMLGMAMIAVHPRQWKWEFTDTLTQIGLAYPFVFLIAQRPKREWFVWSAAILFLYWSWFALTPLPPADFDYAATGVSGEWLHKHGLVGFAAHWQKNSNAAWSFDQWFVNLFPRPAPYPGNDGGLTTLNFVPSIATMVLGLYAADLLRSDRAPGRKFLLLLLAGGSLMSIGLVMGATGLSPIVKAIWTPGWVLVSGGVCCLFLAALFLIVDMAGFRCAVFPLVVVGANSLLAYCLSHVYPSVAFNAFRRVFGSDVFQVLGPAYEPLVYGAVVFAMYWLLLFILYQRRIYVRI